MPLPAARPGAILGASASGAATLRSLVRAGRAFSPDIVNVHCFSGNGVYGSLLAKFLRIPLVITLHGETVMDDNDIYDHSWLLRAGLRIGLSRADAVSACSQFVLADAVDRFGLKPGKGVVVPNGIELTGLEPETPIHVPFQSFVFGLGRMVEKKGFDLLIDAFAAMAPADPEMGLVIGGDGPVRERLRYQVGARDLSDRVLLPGTLSRGQVAWAMAKASVFVLPSRVEPSGIVVLEALRAGTPVIVSSRGGAGEIVRDGVEGRVVDPYDTGALAGAIEDLMREPGRRSSMKGAGRNRVMSYSWEAILDRYLSLYEVVVG